MNEQRLSVPTRREFLIAACGLLIPRAAWSISVPKPLLHWPLEGQVLPGKESVTGSEATLVDATGRLTWSPDDTVKLPRLDGYSVWFEHNFKEPVALGRAISVSAWVALEAYPVETASVVEWGDATSGASLAIDRLGFIVFSIRHESVILECRSQRPTERGRWVHLCGRLGAEGICAIFSDGELIATTKPTERLSQLPAVKRVCMGRARNETFVAKVFPSNVLNGFVRQVRVYGEGLSTQDIRSLSEEFQRHPAPLGAGEPWFVNDVQRPAYHAMPPRAWTNEPHGLVYWRGHYHLFYQKNPNGPYWGHIHWGHMTSPDLLQWTEQPIALTPEQGPDSEGCWSGSAIIANDKIVLFYTGGDGQRSSICMAVSEDGMHFNKHPGNPVIEAPPASVNVKEFRDPSVWKEGDEYRMIIGSGITDVGGTALLYRSTDLAVWHYLKPILIGDKSTSGVFWEMPVLVKIGSHRVLIVCEVPGRASYWVGTWKDDQFTPLHTEPRRLDLFNQFLSPTPYTDQRGRVVAIGIIPETRSSLEQWQAGWAHLYGLPREWTLDADFQLHQTPIGEVSKQFTLMLSSAEKQPVSSTWTVLDAAGTHLFMKVSFEKGDSESVSLALRRSPDRQEETVLRYEWGDAQLTLDRTKSSLNVHTARDRNRASYRPPTPGVIEFHIFIDGSVLEVFLDGQACFTSRIYPTLPDSVGLAASSEGGDASMPLLEIKSLIRP